MVQVTKSRTFHYDPAAYLITPGGAKKLVAFIQEAGGFRRGVDQMMLRFGRASGETSADNSAPKIYATRPLLATLNERPHWLADGAPWSGEGDARSSTDVIAGQKITVRSSTRDSFRMDSLSIAHTIAPGSSVSDGRTEPLRYDEATTGMDAYIAGLDGADGTSLDDSTYGSEAANAPLPDCDDDDLESWLWHPHCMQCLCTRVL